MNRTPRRFNASRSARSPLVKAEKSSMQQRRPESLGWGLLQVPKDVIDAADVGARMALDDSMGLLPSPLVPGEPGLLVGRKRIGQRHTRKLARASGLARPVKGGDPPWAPFDPKPGHRARDASRLALACPHGSISSTERSSFSGRITPSARTIALPPASRSKPSR